MSLPRYTLITLLLACLCAPIAQASDDQASIMMDDDQLLYRNNVTQTRTLVTMRSMGVDAVRATVLWRVVAEGASLSNREIARIKSRKLRDRAIAQRKRFKANDPRTYPTRNWDRYDNLVKEAAKVGLRVYFTITGPGPSYAHRKAPPAQRKNARHVQADPVAATAASSRPSASATRAATATRTRSAARCRACRCGRCGTSPTSPAGCRRSRRSSTARWCPWRPRCTASCTRPASQGLEKSGHGADAILLGETAPLGSDKAGPINGLRPATFLREMVCLAPDGTPYAGADAARRHCQDFDRNPTLKATSFAHHPYTKKAAPTIAPKNPDEITIANIGTLGPLLDTLAAQSGGRIAADLPIFLTEFGYESEPDPRNGIPYARQAQFNQLAEFLAYNEPRVKATTQFLLRDAAPLKRSPVTGRKYKVGSREYWFTYQSGLYTTKGRAKPAAYAYTLPLVVYPAGEGIVGFWGQLRFRPNGAEDTAVFMWCPDNKSVATCVQVGDGVTTTFRGFFSGSVPIPQAGRLLPRRILRPGDGDRAGEDRRLLAARAAVGAGPRRARRGASARVS